MYLCGKSVYADGSICLDILQNQWSPIYDVAAILTSIQVNYFLVPAIVSQVKVLIFMNWIRCIIAFKNVYVLWKT